MVCVASLLEKSCLGLDPGYLEREEVKALVGTCEQRVAWSFHRWREVAWKVEEGSAAKMIRGTEPTGSPDSCRSEVPHA